MMSSVVQSTFLCGYLERHLLGHKQLVVSYTTSPAFPGLNLNRWIFLTDKCWGWVLLGVACAQCPVICVTFPHSRLFNLWKCTQLVFLLYLP